tara:strand:+ start:17947 stop:18168 length:222 start_codon:yes stop_codon:yes gene_type:complete
MADTIELAIIDFEVVHYMEKVFSQACPFIVSVEWSGTPTVGTQIRRPHVEVAGEVIDKWAIGSSVKPSGMNEK